MTMIKKVLYVPAQWSDAIDTSFANQAAAIATNTSWWYTSASRGVWTMQMDPTPMIKLSFPAASWGNIGGPIGQTEITTKLQAIGVNVSAYDRFVIATPGGGYGFKGINFGPWSMIPCAGSDYEFHAVPHELGHSYGLSHSGNIRGGTLVNGLVTLPTGTGGTFDSVGDRYSTMGYVLTRADFNLQEQLVLGWLTSGAGGYATYTGVDTTYTLTPLAAATGNCFGVVAQVTSGSNLAYYYVEYRASVGVDAFYMGTSPPGVQIRVLENAATQGEPALIDADAGTLSYFTWFFPVGSSFNDGVIQIDVVADGKVRIRPAPTIIVSPTTTGNTQMLFDTLVADATAVKTAGIGNITQAMKDKGTADWASLVVDAPNAPPAPVGTVTAYVGVDTTTQGNWRATYGQGGYLLCGNNVSQPSYSTPTYITPITFVGGGDYVWNRGTTDVRAPVDVNGAHVAACHYGSVFTFDINADTAVHRLALYALDWDSNARAQTIDILDQTSGAVLATKTLTSFNAGLWVLFDITGHVRVRVTQTGGANAVLSMIALGA